MKTISEQAIIRWLRMRGVAARCCYSCHSDVYEELPCTILLTKDRDAHVCCGVKATFEFIVNLKK